MEILKFVINYITKNESHTGSTPAGIAMQAVV